MAILDHENQGYLQKAKKELDNDRDWKGCINIDGQLYWLSGYKRENDGRHFLKLLATPRED